MCRRLLYLLSNWGFKNFKLLFVVDDFFNAIFNIYIFFSSNIYKLYSCLFLLLFSIIVKISFLFFAILLWCAIRNVWLHHVFEFPKFLLALLYSFFYEVLQLFYLHSSFQIYKCHVFISTFFLSLLTVFF